MAFKELQVPEFGTVRLYKRRGNRALKISIAADGTIRVSLPTWVPYVTALAFLRSKAAWIDTQRQQQSSLIISGQPIGKAHHASFIPTRGMDNVKSRIIGSRISVLFPAHLHSNDPAVQKSAHSAARRALKIEANKLLPQRLETLAKQRGFEYRRVTTRYLKSRWGSCSQNKDIVLNIFLMQLPWELIDYVLIHELIHTKILHHGPLFWEEFEKQLPGAKKLRKEIKNYQPRIFSIKNA